MDAAVKEKFEKVVFPQSFLGAGSGAGRSAEFKPVASACGSGSFRTTDRQAAKRLPDF